MSRLEPIFETPPSRAHLVQLLRAIKDGTKVHVIPLDKLDYVEAQDDYVALHSGGKSHLKQQSIASLEAILDPAVEGIVAFAVMAVLLLVRPSGLFGSLETR